MPKKCSGLIQLKKKVVSLVPEPHERKETFICFFFFEQQQNNFIPSKNKRKTTYSKVLYIASYQSSLQPSI
ncbi:hypothetical protein HanRHA438_Chr17g0790471 [Helianthus annuus]|nr:hypothetical protein HanRHA438_Chr17g0790471 [Helianthus annuus]